MAGTKCFALLVPKFLFQAHQVRKFPITVLAMSDSEDFNMSEDDDSMEVDSAEDFEESEDKPKAKVRSEKYFKLFPTHFCTHY